MGNTKVKIVTVARSQRRQRGGKKNRKHGRNKVWCAAYKARGQFEKNKAKRMAKHAKRLAEIKERPRKGA